MIRLILSVVLLILINWYLFHLINHRIAYAYTFSSKGLKIVKVVFLYSLNILVLVGLVYLAVMYLTNNPDLLFPKHFLFNLLVIYPFWLSLLFFIQILAYALLFDLFFLIIKWLKFQISDTIHRRINQAFFWIVIFNFIYMNLEIFINRNSFKAEYEMAEINNLHPDLNGLKIALISDIQADYFTDRLTIQKYVDAINHEQVDVVFIAGDMITNGSDYIQVAAEEMAKLRPRKSVIACVGDHDNWAYRSDVKRSLSEIKSAFTNVGLKIYDNENLILQEKNALIKISAVTNTYVERVSKETVALLNGDSLAYDLKIFLTHQPQEPLIKMAQEYNYHLFFAGHTHGGQITFVYPFFEWSPTRFETPYIKGKHVVDDLLIFVSSGLGVSVVPFRMNSQASYTIISLKSI